MVTGSRSEARRRPAGPGPALRLHRWIGIALAGFVLLSAVSGVALAWRDHLWRAQHPELGAEAPRLAAAELAAGVERLLTRHPVDSLRLLAPPRPGLSGWQAWFADGGRALYSADATRLLSRWNETTSPWGILHGLHVELLSGAAGRWFMGATGVAVILLTVLGTVAWLRRPRRPRMKQLVPRRFMRGPWLVAHRHWGIVVALPTLLLMLTGTLMSWSGLWRPGLPPPERFPAAPVTAADASLTRAFRTMRSQWPDAELRFIDVSELPAGRLTARMRQPGEVHPNGRSSLTVTLEGRPVARYDALQSGALGTLDDLIYPLHSGRIDLVGWHLLVVLCGVVLAVLAVSGAVTWLGSLQRQRAGPGRRGAWTLRSSQP